MTTFDRSKNALIAMLALRLPEEVTYDLTPCHNGWKITFDWCNGDFICHGGSYGGNLGYWESMGFRGDEGGVTGWLDKDEVLLRIMHEWSRHQSENEAEVE